MIQVKRMGEKSMKIHYKVISYKKLTVIKACTDTFFYGKESVPRYQLTTSKSYESVAK